MSIKCSCWYFDWTSKSIIGVRLVINHFFNLFFGHIGCIHCNLIVDRKSSSHRGIVIWHHVKVEYLISFFLNYYRINYSSFAWILKRVTILLEDSSWTSIIDNDIKKLRFIVWLELINCFFKLPTRSFELQTFLKEWWSTNSISVNNKLIWDLPFILRSIVLKSIQNEIRKDVCLISTNLLLIFIFWTILLASRILRQIMIVDFSVVLSKMRRFSCCQSYNTFYPMVHHIETNKHGKVVIDLLAHLNSVKILSTFCIDLSQKIWPKTTWFPLNTVLSFYQ